MSNVTSLPLGFEANQPEDPGEGGVAALKLLLRVASARSLALIGVLGGVGVWGWIAFDPSILKLWAGAGYSMGVVLPTIWLSWRQG